MVKSQGKSCSVGPAFSVCAQAFLPGSRDVVGGERTGSGSWLDGSGQAHASWDGAQGWYELDWGRGFETGCHRGVSHPSVWFEEGIRSKDAQWGVAASAGSRAAGGARRIREPPS